eukprot:29634_2
MRLYASTHRCWLDSLLFLSPCADWYLSVNIFLSVSECVPLSLLLTHSHSLLLPLSLHISIHSPLNRNLRTKVTLIVHRSTILRACTLPVPTPAITLLRLAFVFVRGAGGCIVCLVYILVRVCRDEVNLDNVVIYKSKIMYIRA